MLYWYFITILLYQLFAGSRTSSVKDVWIDMSGFCTGVVIVMLVMLLWRAIKRR